MHDSRGNHAKTEAFPQLVGGSAQQVFQYASGESPESLLQAQHAEQEYRYAGRDLLEIGANPEAVGQQNEH